MPPGETSQNHIILFCGKKDSAYLERDVNNEHSFDGRAASCQEKCPMGRSTYETESVSSWRQRRSFVAEALMPARRSRNRRLSYRIADFFLDGGYFTFMFGS